jgi:sugar O-acyltransferase (sialic acid O-acetyltransferase NeuD family)
MKQKVIIFGNGQNAANAYFHLTHDSTDQVVAFTVDRAYVEEEQFLGLPVVPFETVEQIYPPQTHKMLVAVSFQQVNRLRAEKYAQALEKGYVCIRFVSTRATAWPELPVGENTFIGPNCSIGPYAEIGNNVFIAAGCIIGHHTVIGDHSYLAAGCVISGSVTIEPYCFIGAGAVVRDRLKLRRESVVGAGALILEDTVEQGVYMGRMADRLPITSDKLGLG